MSCRVQSRRKALRNLKSSISDCGLAVATVSALLTVGSSNPQKPTGWESTNRQPLRSALLRITGLPRMSTRSRVRERDLLFFAASNKSGH